MTTKAIIAGLDAICGRVLDDNNEVPEKYLIPWRGDKGEALAVVAPKNNSEIKAIVELAKTHGFNIVAQGARTSVVGGAVPVNNDSINVILSLEKLRDTLTFDKIEQRVTVSAGYFLSEINNFLEPHGYEVPINVTSDPMAGAMAATNIAGARVLRYGDFRKLCSGIEVILADEEVSTYSTIDKPRKDNSAMNFTSTFVGSFGKCGIITKVELDAVPIIRSTATAWLYINDKDISELLAKLVSYGDLLLACELVSSDSLETLRDRQTLFKDQSNDLVMIEVGGNYIDAQSELEEVVSSLMSEGLIHDAKFVPVKASWDLRHQISESVQASGQLVGCDISVTRDKFSELRSECIRKVRELGEEYRVCDFGHLGDGGVHMNIVIPFEKEATKETKELIRQTISSVAVELGGSFSAEHGLGILNAGIYEKLTDKTVRALSKAFKLQCDPDQIFGVKELNL